MDLSQLDTQKSGIAFGRMKESEKNLVIAQQFEELSSEARKGILFLSLLKEPIPLFQLHELLGTYELIDHLTQLAFVHTENEEIWLEASTATNFLKTSKWSEKVKAAEKLANFFSNRSLSPETFGNLWYMAGKQANACQAFLEAIESYQQDQQYQKTIVVGEKLLKFPDLSEEDEVLVLQHLLECYECCAQIHSSIQTRKTLLEKTTIQNDASAKAAILRALAIDFAKQGSWSHYKRHREQAANLFREIGQFEESALDFIALTNRAIDEINLQAGFEFAESALTDAQHAQKVELIAKSQAIKAYVMAMQGKATIAHELAEEALELALKNNLLEATAYVYRKLAGTYEYASDYTKAKTVYNQALGLCETEKMESQTLFCYSCLSWVLLRLGEWKKAIEVSKELINDPSVNKPSKVTAHCVIAYIKVLRGEIRSAEKHTQIGIILSQQEGFTLMYHMFHLPRARLFELKGDVVKAEEWYRKIIDEWHQTNERHDVLLSLMDAGIYFLEQKNQEAIKKCLEIFSFICRETGNNEALGCMAYGLGLNALLNEEPEMALGHLEDARKYLAPLNIPYQLLLIDFEIGKCRMALNQIDEAKKTLQEVLIRSKKFGLAPLSSKIASILNTLTLQQSPDTGILTDRQADVLKLLSTGLSNKEIAAALHLSTRTVDMHMRNMFDRLGCNTRWDAIEKARKLGLV